MPFDGGFQKSTITGVDDHESQQDPDCRFRIVRSAPELRTINAATSIGVQSREETNDASGNWHRSRPHRSRATSRMTLMGRRPISEMAGVASRNATRSENVVALIRISLPICRS